MSLNSKAAIAACFATLFIISGTNQLVHSGKTAEHARVSSNSSAQI